MPTKKVTVLVDPALHQQLVRLAQHEHRSLQGQIVYLLERAVSGNGDEDTGVMPERHESLSSSAPDKPIEPS